MKKTTILYLSILFTMSSCSYFYKNETPIVKEGYLYIPQSATFQQVLDSLAPYMNNTAHFESYAETKKYAQKIKPGKYALKKDLTNEELLNNLLLQKEEQVKVRIPNSPTIFHLARDTNKGIIADSTEIVNAILNNKRVKEMGLDLETSKILFIPNTYFFLWLTNGEDFVNRMISEHDKFWTSKRKEQLKKSGLTELEVYTLASIVQLESAEAEEQPKVAKAYLNRLEQGRKLQADPTSVYAYRLEHGFTQQVQRVYHKHLKTTSAYNTYVIYGLPPAPICLPNPSAIDAVLQPATHDYIYFCADPKKPGYHKFTNDYTEHQKNARAYREWLNKNNIK